MKPYALHVPLTERQKAAIAELLLAPERAIKQLPQAEQNAYRAAQESVVEARRSANRVEGRLWIV